MQIKSDMEMISNLITKATVPNKLRKSHVAKNCPAVVTAAQEYLATTAQNNFDAMAKIANPSEITSFLGLAKITKLLGDILGPRYNALINVNRLARNCELIRDFHHTMTQHLLKAFTLAQDLAIVLEVLKDAARANIRQESVAISSVAAPGPIEEQTRLIKWVEQTTTDAPFVFPQWVRVSQEDYSLESVAEEDEDWDIIGDGDKM